MSRRPLDQKTDRQLAGIQLHRTFTDYASGKDTDRPELAQMVGYVRQGDTVVATLWTGWPATSKISAA